MSRTIEVRAVRRRKKIGATLERLTTGVYADPAKTAVMSVKPLSRVSVSYD